MALTHRKQTDGSTEKESSSTSKHLVLRALTLVGGLAALAAVALPSMTAAPVAQAASRFTYRYGLSVQSGWLCRGWSNGTLHCTHHWYRDRSGNLVSLNQPWVPTGGANSGSTARSTGGSHTTNTTNTTHSTSQTSAVTYSTGRGVGLGAEPCSPNVPSSVWTAVNYTRPGAIPPGCYGGVFNINPANYVYRPYFGECNWWPEVLRPDEPGMPYAGNYARGMTPRVGATVHYAPGDHGAGSTGHYGHVESVSPDGRWILTSEMNMYWRGGGFGKVIYRYVNIDSGMYFIY